MATDYFTLVLVDRLWQAEIAMYGREADYWIGGDSANPITIDLLWKEGAQDEETSPGRYSHPIVRHADLPEEPAKGDSLEQGGTVYNVVQVNALSVGYSTLVLQKEGT